MINENNNDTSLLNEIFQTPSQEMRADSLTDSNEAASCRPTGCTGRCGTIS